MSAEYFALPDPTDPSRMTYWRRSKGKLKPWPAKARYGPTLLRSEVPARLKGGERQEWLGDWFRSNSLPWWQALHAAIAEDESGCAARFAAFTTRCCQCGRVLTDSVSKSYGVGPECRDGWPDAVLTAMAEAVGRAHASFVRDGFNAKVREHLADLDGTPESAVALLTGTPRDEIRECGGDPHA